MHLPRLLMVALLVASAPAAGDAPAPAPSRAVLTLIVNGVQQEEALVVLRAGDFLVESEALARSGLQSPPGARVEKIAGKNYLSLASLSPLVECRFDEPALALHLGVHPSLLPSTVIDLRSDTPRGLVHRADTSAFLNYALRLRDLERFEGFSEVGLSVGPALVYSGLSISSQTWVPVRGMTNVTLDERPLMLRWTVGDSFASTGQLGGGVFLGGVTVTRSFDIDPYFVRQPMLGYAGAVLAPSTVDIYVNDTLVRREALPPGPFQVQNIPVTSGAGTVRYVLRDAFGRTTSIASPYYAAPNLLARGLHDFSYSLGLRRENLHVSSLDYRGVAITGRHQYGLTNWLTIGGRVEAAIDLLSGGFSLAMRTPLGHLEVAVAASVADGGGGVAQSISYGYASRRFSLGAQLVLSSDRYATLSLGAQEDKPVLQIGASGSAPIGQRVSLSAQYTYQARRFGMMTDRVGATVSVRIVAGLTLLVSGSWSRETARAGTFEAQAGLTYAFGAGHTAGAAWRQRGDDGAAVLDLSRPMPRGVGAGYRARAVLGQEERLVSTEIQYQSSFGRYGASYDLVGDRSRLLLETSGGLVAIGGRLFATRPVDQAFALIRVPGTPGVRGYLNNQEVGRTDRKGDLLVPDALPYYANRFSVADHDVPLDRTIGGIELQVAPPRRGGAIVLFPIRRTQFLRGYLVALQGRSIISPSYGELLVQGGDRRVASPLGRHGEFDLEGLAPGRYPVEALWAGGRCRFQLDVPATDKLVLHLGEQRCDVDPAVKP